MFSKCIQYKIVVTSVQAIFMLNKYKMSKDSSWMGFLYYQRKISRMIKRKMN